MSRLLPSMSSLRAFEASARHLSFSKAADELNLTQSAISRQMKTLEEVLGLKLFHRVRRRIVLSEAGAAYAESVRGCLSQIEDATLDVLAYRSARNVLNVAVLPVFGTKWLISHMPEFWRLHPGLTVNVRRPGVPFDFTSNRFDAAILFGEVSYPRGFIAERLMAEQFVVVCAPALTEERALSSVGDLARHTLLQHTALPQAWQHWLQAARASRINGLKGPRFERFSLVLSAAIGMRGVALLPGFLVKDAVASGRLVTRFNNISLPDTYAYYLIYPKEKKELPALRLFRDWLRAATSSSEADEAAAV